MTKHRLQRVQGDDEGRFHGACSCGHIVISSDRVAEPDIEKRKEFVYEELAKHWLSQPEVRAMLYLP